MKYSAAILLAFFSPTPVLAQDFTELMIEGIAREGASRAVEVVKEVPERLESYLTNDGLGFSTDQECLSELQALTNVGAIASNILPFSSVWAFETEEGFGTRLRLLVNGKKFHAEFRCERERLVVDVLAWGASIPQVPEYETDTLDAALGTFVLVGERDAIGNDVTDQLSQNDLPQSSSVDSPPLTGAEKTAFRKAVQGCYVVNPEVSNVIVTIRFSFEPSGRVIPSSIHMVDGAGGTDAEIENAFTAATRAILRCQGSGYDLPPEKYDQWRVAELTFDRDGMREL